MLEVVLAVAIGSVVLAGASSSYLTIYKGCISAANYFTMTSEGRSSLSLFGRDMRMARDIQVFVNEEDVVNHIIVDIPAAEDGLEETVEYEFLQNIYSFQKGLRYRMQRTHKDSDGEIISQRKVLNNILEDGYHFVFYNTLGEETSQVSSIKEIQIAIKMQKNVRHINNTDLIISARYMMRNKFVTN